MNPNKIKIFSIGLDALTIEFDQIISTELNIKAINLSERLSKNPFEGFIEAVPAYSSVTFFFDLPVVRKKFPQFPTAFSAVKNLIQAELKNDFEFSEQPVHLIEVPFVCDDDSAPDLSFVSEHTGLSKVEVLDLFLSKIYRVFMLGFLPGFAYLGELDAALTVPRKTAPRLKVAAGSVGLAGRQTGIYPIESPGGWQIIGRTEIELFNPYKNQPSLFRAGDSVKFVRV